jgi:hypothetical protein
VRPGDIHTAPNDYEPDSLSIRGSTDVVIDHVSASWSTDEVLSPTHDSHNVTVQWSMITEALHNSNHHKGNHGYGSLINGGDYSFHHNLLAHNRSRNTRPQEGGSRPTRLDFVNNVIYNPGNKFGYGGDDTMYLNFVGNYGIAGPNTQESDLFDGDSTDTLIYQQGNYMDLNENGALDGESSGWGDFGGTFTQSASRFSLPPVTTESAEDAVASVLAYVGSSLVRDAVDTRIVDTVASWGTAGAHLDSQQEVGGWPLLQPGTPWTDTDRDGMPDAFESAYRLDEQDPSDRNGFDLDNSGYTNLEVYLNALAAPVSSVEILAGDYNNNGVVDAADLTIWRDSLGFPTVLLNEAASYGIVDEADLVVWRQNFGATLPVNSVVPEPQAWLLFAAAAVCLLGGTRRP